MREISGDLWAEHAAGAVVVITTNGAVTRDGKAIMLRGCACQAKERYPELTPLIRPLLDLHGMQVFELGRRIVSFPVEADPYQNPELCLIEQSCRELVELVDIKGWQRIVVPRPGCGGGGLAWDYVRPVLEQYFDERFYVISKEQ